MKNSNTVASNPVNSITLPKDSGTLKELDAKLVWVMAAACALSVANLYYAQPVLVEMGKDFHTQAGSIGIVATLCQAGYALGLLLIVPLGDKVERRSLIVRTLLAVALALVGVALAPSFLILAAAATLVGITTVVPQIIIPFAANLARAERRGRVIGNVMSGLLIGILLSRTLSGLISAHFGWRTVYWLAAVMMVLLALILARALPQDTPQNSLSYWGLLRSLWQLVKSEPVLREAAVFGGLAFGAFSAFWVTLAFLLAGPPFSFGSEVVGLFGLVGIGGATAATVAGRLADRLPARRITGIALTISLISFIFIWLGTNSIWMLVVGVILLDLGAQGNQISNQSRIYSLKAEARSRLNTVYMVSYFVGGSLGSLLGVYGWSAAGWNGVCAVGVALLAASLLVYGLNLTKYRESKGR